MKYPMAVLLSALLLACTDKNPTAQGSLGGARGVVQAGEAGSPRSSGGQPIGGSGASGAPGVSGGGASSAGSAGAPANQGGTAGAPSAGNAGTTTAPPSSGLPVPPGDANVARPEGPPGKLEVLDWAGFQGAVSFTFDDTNSSQIEHYDALAALGARYTFYLMTSKSAELDDPVWVRAVEDGHELGNHTRYHEEEDAGGVDTDAATRTLEEKFGIKVYTMAAPYGSDAYIDVAKTRFLINRGVAPDPLIAPNDDSDPFNLTCYIPSEGATAEGEMNAQIDAARDAGRWRIVLVHGFVGGDDSAYLPVSIDEFVANVSYATSFGDLWVDSVVNVGAYWRGQKAFTDGTREQRGDDTVWTWTLPAHFPPGKVLRVRVEGGTLTQNGQELAWDPHGYYEVALDAGTLTLSPP